MNAENARVSIREMEGVFETHVDAGQSLIAIAKAATSVDKFCSARSLCEGVLGRGWLDEEECRKFPWASS